MITFGAEVLKKYGVEVSPGTSVVREGEDTREMYIVHRGELDVIKNISGHERLLGHINEGEFFGELSLLNNEPRSATVRATRATTLLRISPEAFETLLKKAPELSLKIIKALASRLKKTNEEVASLHELDDDLKLVKTLISKVNTIGQKTPKGAISVNSSIDAIADEIKSPPEIIKKIKTDLLNATNIMQFNEEGGFEVLDLSLLSEFAEFIAERKKLQTGG